MLGILCEDSELDCLIAEEEWRFLSPAQLGRSPGRPMSFLGFFHQTPEPRQ